MNLEEIKDLERAEFIKRDKELCFIPSEGLPSEDVLEAQSSIHSLKYLEGRAKHRFYNGCEECDKMELLGEQLLLKLFNAEERYNSTIQPHSGSQANQIVYGSILQLNDIILSMDVSAGSHISHNHKLSFIGKYHNVISYGLDDNGIIDYEQIERLAIANKPKLLIVGISAYSREIDFKRIKEIADKVGAYTMADIAHITALVISGLHQNPVDYDYDFVTMTCHKQLNGPRGGCVIYKKEFEKDISRGILPYHQGGPIGSMMYAKTVRFNEILNDLDSFKKYALSVKNNASAMAKTFIENGIKIVSGGTDNHLMLLDLSEWDISGRDIANILEECGIITNCNSVPNEQKGFFKTSGIRLGTPFITARGLNKSHCTHLAQMISDLLIAIRDGKDTSVHKECLAKYVETLTTQYPLKNIYPNRYKYLFGDK